MCLVEIEKSLKPIAACAMPISPNMKIFTDTPLVKKAREGVLELLLLNHPLDCPICDQGGECDLQEQVMNYGSDRSRFYEKKRDVEDKNCGPLIKTIMTRCIHCTRCVRFASEIVEIEYLGTVNRGQQTEITTFIDRAILTELSGNLIDLCPVGALTSKPYAFSTRPWELNSIESIDIFDSLGTSIKVDYKESKVIRILPKFNQNLTDKEWITDKIRFFYDGLYTNRLTQPVEVCLNSKIKYNYIFWDSLIQRLKTLLTISDSSKICFIVGNTLDSQTIIATKTLAENLGVLKVVHDRLLNTENIFLSDYSLNLKSILKSDCIFLIGTNPRMEANLLNLQIQQNVKKKNVLSAIVGSAFIPAYNKNKFISGNLASFLKILEGTHKYSKIFKTSKYPIIIYGTSVLERIDSKQFLKTLYFFNKNIKILNENSVNLLSSDSNFVGNLNLGISSFSPEILKSVKIIYMIHPSQEFLNYINEYTFFNLISPVTIYQGSHFLTNKKSLNKTKNLWYDSLINYFIPGKTFIEKEGVYFNLENKYQKTSKIPNSIINLQNREDSQILQILNNKVTKNFTSKLFELAINKVTKNFTYYYFFSKIKIYKTLLKPIIEDFYLTNTITQNSTIMGKCSNVIKKNAQNFIH